MAENLPDLPLTMTPQEEQAFQKATACYYCNQTFNSSDETLVKVRDHCHFSGKYRGALHSICNTKLQQKRFIPVFADDERTFIRALDGYKVDIIAKNVENFISFGFKIDTVEIKFLDSLKFLNGSLDTLTKNLLDRGDKGQQSLVYTKQHFEENFDDSLLRKGVYPYEYVTSEKILDTTTTLPTIENFYSSLKDEHISTQDYIHAQTMWKRFNCKTLRDYTEMYLKLDTTLLADIFENFRTCIYQEYNLDPVYYVTLSSLGLDCALKLTQQELDMIHDVDKYNFLKSGIRGGISMICKRYAKTNNEQCSDYDPNKPTSHIFYVDANNL